MNHGYFRAIFALAFACVLPSGTLATVAQAQGYFINFETPVVSPIQISPDGTRLAVCNLPDSMLDILDLTVFPPRRIYSVPVGLDPVSCRFRTDSEVWVVNHISDSVSVVDLELRAVVHTLHTEDEPYDVVFAGDPQRAFVSCGQTNAILVFDPSNLDATPGRIPVLAEKPRMLAVSPDGATVYAALFESGNSTTILGGGLDEDGEHALGIVPLTFPPNVVSDPRGPYGGVNPPPNTVATPSNPRGFQPQPPQGSSPPPPMSLIVRQDGEGVWRDDNGRDWTALVSGPLASASGRPEGWTLLQNDIAVIDADSLEVSYIERLMTTAMALAVNPATGQIHLAGTEAMNQVRFEPNLRSRFTRVVHAVADPVEVRDLNPHLDYQFSSVPMAERLLSIGDPRAIVWTHDGSRAYVAGMGSNNIIGLDTGGARIALPRTANGTIPVGQGPAGLALDEARGRLYAFNRFDMTLSVIRLDLHTEMARVRLHDSTPQVIREGRPHLYNTHQTSGLGQASCASCHIDARKDRLAWDLGNPSGAGGGNSRINQGAGVPFLFESGGFHPMKGPMTTQTLQDIIGKEPLHWRGDRRNIEQFNGTFTALQAADSVLTAAQMQAFKEFLGTIHFPPNPFRNPDNSLPTNLPLDGHHATGKFELDAGEPLPNGNAQAALQRYRSISPPLTLGFFSCAICHSLPTGAGPNSTLNLSTTRFIPIAPGPNGEAHLALVTVDGTTNRAMKIPQLRNLYDKTGFDMTQQVNTAGFGFLHDGSVDTIARFLSQPAFLFTSDQDVADMAALLLAFSGSEFGPPANDLDPPGVASQDVHAAVGMQHTMALSKGGVDFVDLFEGEAQRGMVDLIAVTRNEAGDTRGYLYLPAHNLWMTDSLAETALSRTQLLEGIADDRPITFTVTPHGSGFRLAIDRDGDGLYNYDEIRDWNPTTPEVVNPFDPANPDTTGNRGSTSPNSVPDGQGDFNGNGFSNAEWIAMGGNPIQAGPADVDYSGQVNAVDVQLVINAALGVDVSPVDADVNNDDEVNAIDVQLVINAALGVT